MKKTFLLLPVFLSPLFAASLKAATIIHNPVLSAVAGEPVQVDASLSGVKAPASARLFFRSKGKELYQSEEMGGSNFVVSAVIPGSAVSSQGLEYYIQVTDANGTVTDPANNPSLNPHFVSVRERIVPTTLTVLSPQDGDVVDTARPIITVSFKQGDSSVDTNSVLLEVDGEAIKDKENLQVFSTLLSYVPGKDFSEGRHTVRVKVKKSDGSADQVEWSFSVQTTAKPQGAQNWFWNGGLSLQTQYAGVVQASDPNQAPMPLVYRPYGANRGTLDVTGRGPNQTYKLHVYQTDEERVDQQPLDRYLGSYSNDELDLYLGDYSPNFSTLSLYNLYFLRGVTLDLHSGDLYEGHSRLIVTGGMTQRAVQPGPASVIGGTVYGQYREDLYGARYEVGSPHLLQWGLNAVTINDDGNSVGNMGGVNPNNNLVITSDGKLHIDPLYLTLDGEGGASLGTQDGTLTGVFSGTGYQAGAHLNVLPSSTRADFTWRDLAGGFSFVPAGFASMGNPGLLPDYRGFESSFSQPLFSNQTSLSLAFNKWRDNLQYSKPFTTNTEYYAAFYNLNFNNLPTLSLGYTLQNQYASDIVPLSTTAATNNQVGNFNATLGYNRVINPHLVLSGNLSVVNSNYTDQAFNSPNFHSNTFVISGFGTYFNTSLNLALSLGTTNFDAFSNSATGSSPAYSSLNNSYSLRLNQTFIPTRLSGYLGYDLNTSQTNQLQTSSSRSTPALGATYTMGTQSLDAQLAYAAVSQQIVGVSNSYTQFFGSLTYRYTF